MYLLNPRLTILVPLVAAVSLACGTATQSSPSATTPNTPTTGTLISPLPSLGTAGNYALLAGTAVTCTGTSVCASRVVRTWSQGNAANWS
jgi:hypothetical protein